MDALEQAVLLAIKEVVKTGSEEFKFGLCNMLDKIGFVDEYYVTSEIIDDRIAKEVEAAERSVKEQMYEQLKNRFSERR